MTPPTPVAPVPPAKVRGSRRGRRLVLAAATLLLVATAGLVAAFDWTWFRPLIQFVVQQRSGRHIDFETLQVGLDDARRPTFRFRQLVIQNAAWASPRPLIRAAEVGVVMAWPTFGGGPWVVTRLHLVDAVIDLERRADGSRNWRLWRPDDRGPGRVRVLSVDARGTHARFVNHELDLALDLQTAALPAPITLASVPASPLTQRIDASGTRAGMPFTLRGAVSEVVTFYDTGQAFAVKLDLTSGVAGTGEANVLQAEGRMADLLQAGAMELDLRLAGPRPADHARLFGVTTTLPPLDLKATARLQVDGPNWRLTGLQAASGRSELVGDVAFEPATPGRPRGLLRAKFSGARLHVADLARRAAPPASRPSRATARPHAPGFDAEIDFENAALRGLPLGDATGGRGRAAWRNGRWSIEPLTFAFAGGDAVGALVVDTVATPNAYALDLRLRRWQLARLMRDAPGEPSVEGALDARLALRALGDTSAALIGAVSGNVQAELVGATVPESLDARLALDGGRLLRSVFAPGERAPIVCSSLDVRFEAGQGSVRRLAFDTPQASFTGAGRVDLARRSIDLVVTPRRKQAALLALDRALQVSGPWGGPTWSLIAPGGVPVGEPCRPGGVP